MAAFASDLIGSLRLPWLQFQDHSKHGCDQAPSSLKKMTRSSGFGEGNYASFKSSRSRIHPAVNQELTHSSLQTSNGVGEGGELREDLPLLDEAIVQPSAPCDLQESSKPKRKGLRSTATRKKIELPVDTKKAKLPARSGHIKNAPKGQQRQQPRRRNKTSSAAQHAPNISTCSLPRGSLHCDKPSLGFPGSQISESHLGHSSLHHPPVTTVRPEGRNMGLIQIPQLEWPDTQNYRRCSSEPPFPLRVASGLHGCHTSSPSAPAEAQSRDVGDHPEPRSWARHFPTHVVEASSSTASRLPVIFSSSQHSNVVLDKQCSTNSPHQRMSNSERLMPVTTVGETTEAYPDLGGITSPHPKRSGQDRLMVGKGLLGHKEVEMPGNSTWEASDCILTSEDYHTVKRNLAASENTYKRLSAAYQEFHRTNTIAHQRASNAESELKRLRKQLTRLEKENTRYKANCERLQGEAKQKNDQAVVGAQQKSPLALGSRGEFEHVRIDLQGSQVPTTNHPSPNSRCEKPAQSPFVGAWISPPLSVVNTKEPCMPEMEGVDACSGPEGWTEFGELGKGLDNLDWGDMDPMEIEMACNSIFEDMP